MNTAPFIKARRNLENIIRQPAARLSAAVVSDTPVETGALRGSWTPNKGSPRANNVDGGANQNIAGVINSLKPGDKFYLCNGQPYGPRIEYEGWSHDKAPAGMVRINTARFAEFVRGSYAL